MVLFENNTLLMQIKCIFNAHFSWEQVVQRIILCPYVQLNPCIALYVTIQVKIHTEILVSHDECHVSSIRGMIFNENND